MIFGENVLEKAARMTTLEEYERLAESSRVARDTDALNNIQKTPSTTPSPSRVGTPAPRSVPTIPEEAIRIEGGWDNGDYSPNTKAGMKIDFFNKYPYFENIEINHSFFNLDTEIDTKYHTALSELNDSNKALRKLKSEAFKLYNQDDKDLVAIKAKYKEFLLGIEAFRDIFKMGILNVKDMSMDRLKEARAYIPNDVRIHYEEWVEREIHKCEIMHNSHVDNFEKAAEKLAENIDIFYRK